MLWKLKFSKTVNNKKHVPKLKLFNENNFRNIPKILDIENWLWKSEISIFDHWILKVCWSTKFFYWKRAIYHSIKLPCPNVSTTPITTMGCRQCLSLSAVQLKSKHCQKPQCRSGVVDMFGPFDVKAAGKLLNGIYCKHLKHNRSCIHIAK